MRLETQIVLNQLHHPFGDGRNGWQGKRHKHYSLQESLSDKVSNFADEGFWGSYNIIEPTESLEHAVNKLKKQHR